MGVRMGGGITILVQYRQSVIISLTLPVSYYDTVLRVY